MNLIWLDAETPFPDTSQALSDPDGLLAVGGDLSVARLRSAYRQGIFPWFNPGDPILWWSPDPRMILAVEDFHPSHSLRKRLRQIEREAFSTQPHVEVRVDTAFSDVMAACAAPRATQPLTWISPAIQQAYQRWHEAGEVHSIETWIDGELAGGLYGISLGSMFFGESMFARAPDASKIALALLVAFLKRHGVTWIDCQQQTGHLASLGAQPVSRAAFQAHLREALPGPTPPWRPGRLHVDGRLV